MLCIKIQRSTIYTNYNQLTITLVCVVVVVYVSVGVGGYV